jgi:hypothetical protein
MKKYLIGSLLVLFAVLGINAHNAHAYTWCFAQTNAGVTSYAQDYYYDFGTGGGVMRCTTNGWVSSPGSVPSTQVGASSSASMTLSWPGMAGAVSYTLVLSEAPNFMSPSLTQIVASNSWLASGLKPNTTYYYHVYGATAGGEKTPYSPTWFFTTNANGSAGSMTNPTVSPTVRWVNSSGNLVTPSAVNVDFTDNNGNVIFPQSSWNMFGPER